MNESDAQMFEELSAVGGRVLLKACSHFRG